MRALLLIFLAGVAAGQCDSSGACYQAVAGSVLGSAAPSQCSTLPNASWTIASMIDSVTQQSIQQRCFNTVPSGQAFWIGLYDSRCCNQRTPSGRTNRSYTNWQWRSGDDNSFFVEIQDGTSDASSPPNKSPWSSGEPNNAGGREGCVEVLSNNFLNDIPCGNSFSWTCCQYFLPSASPTTTASPTASLSFDSSPSLSPNATLSGSSTPSSSSSVWVEVDASPDPTAGLVGGLVAAIVVGGIAAAAFFILWPAYALWERRRRSRRGGALRSTQRVINTMKRDKSARTIVTPAGDEATRNPAAVAIAMQMQMVQAGVADAFPPPPPPPEDKGDAAAAASPRSTRFTAKPSAARKPSARGM